MKFGFIGYGSMARRVAAIGARWFPAGALRSPPPPRRPSTVDLMTS